jgi:uncharacterized SAM-binding protein YcdF (DUF218 family)
MTENSSFSLSSAFDALCGFPFTTTAIRPADLGLVFGNPKLIPELAETAARFYHAGFFPRLVATGGVNGPSGQPEALEIAEHLRLFDVPAEAILVEPDSQHTGQNVTKTRSLIEASNIEVNSVLGFGCATAGPRFLMTLAQRWPEVLAMHIGVYPQGLGSHNCLQDGGFLRRLFQEMAKIEPYIERGEISPVDLAARNAAILASASPRP